jgi:transposase InsO family protein/transposase-like protein
VKVSYTPKQRQKAIDTYEELRSYSATLRVLGYPSRHVLYNWVKGISRKKASGNSLREARHYDWRLKFEAVRRTLDGEGIRDVAKELGITNYATVYEWARNWRTKGSAGLMSKKEQIEAGIYKTKAQLKKALPDDVGKLEDLAARLLVEKAVLEQELELAKKPTGSIPGKLLSRHKAQIANSLKAWLPLELLLEVLALRPSSYYYARVAAAKPDRYRDIRPIMHEISGECGHAYGSPRIWSSLRRRGVFISEKVVRRLMKEEGIEVRYAKRKRRYSSYVGEVTPAVNDLVKRNFHADSPNALWLTDITEFAAADSKVYLSPVIDCYDGRIVSWETSRHPDNLLVESMIDKAIDTLDAKTIRTLKDKGESKALVVHTDRGGHYRGGMWIEKLEGRGFLRSMSRKGNSGDNAACEGFFGRMKTEMYHEIRWNKASELEAAIDSYIDFYNNRRIKMSLGGISIKEHRDRLGEVSRKQS